MEARAMLDALAPLREMSSFFLCGLAFGGWPEPSSADSWLPEYDDLPEFLELEIEETLSSCYSAVFPSLKIIYY